MKPRDRIMNSLLGEPVDRIAWAPLIGDYFLASLVGGSLYESLGKPTGGTPESDPFALVSQSHRKAIDFMRFIGADVLERHSPIIKAHSDDLVVEETVEGTKVNRRYLTSVGALSETIYRVPESPAMPFYGSEYLVKTPEDLRVYRHIWENTCFQPDYQSFLAEQAYIGDSGVPVVDGPQSAVQFLLGEVAGVEGFYCLLADHREEMEGLIATMHAKRLEAYELIARSPARVVFAQEDLSSTTSSPRIFEAFSWRHLNEYADILHGEGKVFVAHMCGLLKEMAPLIAQSRLDGVESVTPPPVGNLSVREARRLWGSDFVIIGGLHVNVMLEANQDLVRAAVTEALRQAAPGSKFILSNADAMPFGARLDTLLTIGATVREHGAFPLDPTTL